MQVVWKQTEIWHICQMVVDKLKNSEIGCTIPCIYRPKKYIQIYLGRQAHTVIYLGDRYRTLSIFIRVALLALGQSLDCHSASEVSLMDMEKSVNI